MNTKTRTASEFTSKYHYTTDIGELEQIANEYYTDGDITGAFRLVGNAEITETWVTDYNAPYLATTPYHQVYPRKRTQRRIVVQIGQRGLYMPNEIYHCETISEMREQLRDWRNWYFDDEPYTVVSPLHTITRRELQHGAICYIVAGNNDALTVSLA